MRRRPRPGDVALGFAIAVLVGASAHHLRVDAAARDAGVAAFERSTLAWPGQLSAPGFVRAYGVTMACATHHSAIVAPADYRLCKVLSGSLRHQRLFRCSPDQAVRCIPPEHLAIKRSLE